MNREEISPFICGDRDRTCDSLINSQVPFHLDTPQLLKRPGRLALPLCSPELCHRIELYCSSARPTRSLLIAGLAGLEPAARGHMPLFYRLNYRLTGLSVGLEHHISSINAGAGDLLNL